MLIEPRSVSSSSARSVVLRLSHSISAKGLDVMATAGNADYTYMYLFMAFVITILAIAVTLYFFKVTINLNVILSRSNSPRFMYLYTWYVKYSMILSTRFDVGWHFSDLVMDTSNCSKN